tara:strand:- start:231 stop:713 length:483 start_codon:yes stop_codon:yes gene_type:complete
MSKFTHIDNTGKPSMVDVSEKKETYRIAEATGAVYMLPKTLELIEKSKIEKGEVLNISQLAGIMGAKKTSELIPLCHPLNLSSIKVELTCNSKNSSINVKATCKVFSKTGVEMEALTAVSVACLTIYDMCKAVDREMNISDIQLNYKSGGKSGVFKKKVK